MKSFLRSRYSRATSINAVLEAHKVVDLDLGQELDDVSPEPAGADLAGMEKRFPRLPFLQLPRPPRPLMPLAQIVGTRRSVRTFDTDYRMSLETLAAILDLAVSQQRDPDGSRHRSHPSAGASYPTEIYLVPIRFTNLDSGLYYYSARDHGLTVLLPEIEATTINNLICDDEIVNANLLFIVTAAFYRSCSRYGGRGYRYALIEAGSVAQTLDYCCRCVGLATVWIGGFPDNLVQGFLDINWELELEAPVLMMAVGSKTQ